MNNIQNELEKILSDLNKQISKGEFNIERNEKIIEIIINIYKAAKTGNIAYVKLLVEQLKIIFGVSNMPEIGENDKISETRDWNFTEDDEEIASSEVESITGVFLNNLKSYNG